MRNVVRKQRVTRRGFTLVELLAAVAIIGIVAALAMVGYRKYINAAAASEAKAVMQGIRGAEENYKAEMLVYLQCSGALNDYYPRTEAALNSKKAAWRNPGDAAHFACFQQLNVATNGAVTYGYAVMAGLPPAISAAPVGFASPPVWPAVTEPWYVIQAAGDRDEDGIRALFLTSSLHGEIYSENDSE
jgi:type IV pilus assembly protein PilA